MAPDNGLLPARHRPCAEGEQFSLPPAGNAGCAAGRTGLKGPPGGLSRQPQQNTWHAGRLRASAVAHRDGPAD